MNAMDIATSEELKAARALAGDIRADRPEDLEQAIWEAADGVGFLGLADLLRRYAQDLNLFEWANEELTADGEYSVEEALSQGYGLFWRNLIREAYDQHPAALVGSRKPTEEECRIGVGLEAEARHALERQV